MPNFLKEAEKLFDYTRALRRDFHLHPELGLQEYRTAGIIANELKSLDLEVSTGIAETGVVAIIEGGKPGPTVLLRFDMDALPVTEETGVEYTSLNEGIMHACGHDGHMAIGLTVAQLLNKHREELTGTVKLVFQPGEEGLGGGERMVNEGVLENPRPDYALALHLWNEFQIGTYSATPGPVMAGSQTFNIKLTGKGAHAAAPHQGVDPVIAAAHIVTALQSIASRNIDPLESAVISITKIHAGEAFNVIPNDAVISGTIRTFKPMVREYILKHFYQIAEGIGESMGCEVEIDINVITPVLVNNEDISKRVQKVVKGMFPDDILLTDARTMGAEDMAYFLAEIPGCYFFVGSSNPRKGLGYGHHHPKFNIDEDALPRGAALMAAAAVELLSNGHK
ncbi:MAG: M20 family metallopeptidase [Chloroflexota bacterium]